MAQKAVIGGGIAGLIWAAFNHDWLVLSKQIGGQLDNDWTGPRLLHDHPETRYLLERLNFPIIPKEARVGYWYEGSLQPTCPESLRVPYYLKSRGLKEASNVPASVMSGGDETVHHLEVNWRLLVVRLTHSAIGYHKIIHEDVEKLEPSGNYLVVNETHAFSQLVWTPPLPLLLKKLGLENHYRGVDKTFILVPDFKDFDLGPYDYVYLPGPEFSYHRVTKVNEGVVLEWTGDEFNFEMLCEEHPGLKGSAKHKTLKGSQLIPSERDPYSLGIPDRIKLLGRFAEWKHSIKIEDVIRKASSAAGIPIP